MFTIDEQTDEWTNRQSLNGFEFLADFSKEPMVGSIFLGVSNVARTNFKRHPLISFNNSNSKITN